MSIDRIAVVARECSQNNKINEIIDQLNINTNETPQWTGWAAYADTQYTELAPFSVANGTTVRVPNNAGTTIVDQLPVGISALYDGTKITPVSDGDAYDLRVSFTARSNNNAGSFLISVDISPNGDGTNIVTSIPVKELKGVGQWQLYTVALPIFTRATFLANGGKVLVTPVVGGLDIYGMSFFIVRTHKAR